MKNSTQFNVPFGQTIKYRKYNIIHLIEKQYLLLE